MALLFCDGFDNYAATADFSKKWGTSTGWTYSASGGRFGGGALTHAGGASGNAIAFYPAVAVGFYMGFWMKASNAPSVQTSMLQVSTSASTFLKLNTNGTLAFSGVASTQNSTINVCDGQWHWIEFSCVNTASNIYVDNLVQFSTNVNMDRCGGGQSSFLSVNGVALSIDDVILYDLTGTSFNTYPINSRQITSRSVASDGVCSFATLSSGTSHNALLSETNPDGDASYVEDGTSGNQDLLGIAALGYTPAVINAVMLNAYLKVGGSGGSINNQLICKSGATTAASASAATPSSYATRQVPFPVDPNTSAAWAVSALNAAQFGYKNP